MLILSLIEIYSTFLISLVQNISQFQSNIHHLYPFSKVYMTQKSEKLIGLSNPQPGTFTLVGLAFALKVTMTQCNIMMRSLLMAMNLLFVYLILQEVHKWHLGKNMFPIRSTRAIQIKIVNFV